MMHIICILKLIPFTLVISHRYKFYMVLQGTLLFDDTDISDISHFFIWMWNRIEKINKKKLYHNQIQIWIFIVILK